MDANEKTRLQPGSIAGKYCPVITPLEKWLLVILVFVVAIGICLSISLVTYYKNKGHSTNQNEADPDLNKTEICLTLECIAEASSLLQSMNQTVDPCEDFYSFVCGNWIKQSLLISDIDTQFMRLGGLIVLRVKDLLDNLKNQKELPEHEKKVKDFYDACMDMDHREEVGARPLLKDLENFGGWPLIDKKWNVWKFSWVDLMIKFFKTGYTNTMLLDIQVETDIKNASTFLIAVRGPMLALKNRMYYVLPFDSLIENYKKLIYNIACLLLPGLNENEAMKDIEAAFEIENRLAYASDNEKKKNFAEHYYHIMTLEEIQIFAPKIPWRKLFVNLLPSNITLKNNEKILVTVPKVVKELNSILEEKDNKDGKRALANYMFYRIVLHAVYDLDKNFYQAIQNFQDEVGTRELIPLWQSCTHAAVEFFHYSITAMYAHRYMDDTTKNLLEMMFNDMRNSLIEEISNAEWLDNKTKEYALLKANSICTALAYPQEIMDNDKLNEYYKDLHITDDHFSNVKKAFASEMRIVMEGLHEKRTRLKWSYMGNLLIANAYYAPTENSIVIPVGLLQRTFFAPRRPNYLNYGSLGTIVGHELTHAFDSIGSLYDAEGTYRMWWSNSSWEKFQNKTKCYVDQYNKFHEPSVDTEVNGTLTLGENIADNGGLQSAYYAYRKLLERIGSEQTLPGLPYTEKQMFWISFASVWCRKQTNDSLHYVMTHSVHSPSKFRVLGSLSNMKEFADDFECKLESGLHPKEKCSLWK